LNSGNSICKTIEVIETGKSRPGQSGTSIWLAQDTGTSWYGPETLGTATTLSNSQCEIDVENSSVAGDGTLLNLTVTYEFLTDFGGSAGVWGNVEDGSTGSPWPWIGGWTPNQAPTADSVSPASGSGSDPEFTFEFSDADGHGTLQPEPPRVFRRVFSFSPAPTRPAAPALQTGDSLGKGEEADGLDPLVEREAEIARIDDEKGLELQIRDGDAHGSGGPGSFGKLELETVAPSAAHDEEIQLGAPVGCPEVRVALRSERTDGLLEREAFPRHSEAGVRPDLCRVAQAEKGVLQPESRM
jgi:hypothetical protein